MCFQKDNNEILKKKKSSKLWSQDNIMEIFSLQICDHQIVEQIKIRKREKRKEKR